MFEFVKHTFVGLMLGIIFVDFFSKVADLHAQLGATQETILVEKAYEGDAYDKSDDIFIMSDECDDWSKTTHWFYEFSCKLTIIFSVGTCKIENFIVSLQMKTTDGPCVLAVALVSSTFTHSLTEMEEYIVSARKYRPQTFDDVVGQSALTTTLKNAVHSGKLAHAYLFCGPRGVGKTTCARIFAKTINCLHPGPDGEACNECESCKAFNEQRSYNIIELDAASNNSVEDIKQLMQQTYIPPQIGRYKVFIIDEVHMLSPSAFNAFLKTLEEPPAHVIFILATTEKHKILPTIISRCQIYDFERMSVSDTVDHLKHVAEKENITYEEAALDVIAQKADGGMRDALSIFDQAASFCQGNITYEKVIEDLNELDVSNYFQIVDLSIDNKVCDIMLLLNSIIANGFDGGHLVTGLASHIRNVLMAKDEQTIALLQTSQQMATRYAEQAKKCPTQFLYKALRILNTCDLNYRQSSNKRLLVELTLIEVAQITQPDDDTASAGRSPKRLKTLFRNLITTRPNAAQQVAAVGKQPSAEPRTSQSAPQHESQPTVEQAAPAPAVTPLGGKRLKLANLGNTFASLNQKPKASENIDADAETKGENEPFTQEMLDLQWLSMCNRMPHQMVAMATRMKNLHPQITTFPNIEVIVANQTLLDEMTTIVRRIRATMAKMLHNSGVEIHLRLADASEIKPILSKRELFALMEKDNKAVHDFVEELGLEPC